MHAVVHLGNNQRILAMRGEEDPAITNDLLGNSFPMAIIFFSDRKAFNIHFFFACLVLQVVTFVINLVQVVQNMRT
jgi:hypothetical protein